MKLNGLNVVISMEYLMTLKDFFLDSLPPKSPSTSVPAPRPGGHLTSCTDDWVLNWWGNLWPWGWDDLTSSHGIHCLSLSYSWVLCCLLIYFWLALTVILVTAYSALAVTVILVTPYSALALTVILVTPYSALALTVIIVTPYSAFAVTVILLNWLLYVTWFAYLLKCFS